MSEAELQKNVAMYLRMQYPDVVFHSDFGSGVKLTPRQAVMQKMQNGGKRAWPDMFIAEPAPRCIDGGWDNEYHGLFIELKKDGVRLKKKNGEWANPHIKEQALLLGELDSRGYKAVFAVGIGEAIDVIDEYLGGKKWA